MSRRVREECGRESRKHTRKRLALVVGLLPCAVLGWPLAPVFAQEEPAPATQPAGSAAGREADRSARQNELDSIQADIAAREARLKTLRSEIEGLRKDRLSLNQALLETAERLRTAEDRVNAIEQRLATLDGSEQAIRESLQSRRGVIAEVLAALQRMGRHPPPAVLVTPEDMLQAVHSAILLGAVVPELRAEAEALAADLAELARLREQITKDREALKVDIATLNAERERLDLLVSERQSRLAEVEQVDADESRKVQELAGRTEDLKDLIDGMEQEIAASRQAADDARRASESRAKDAQDKLAAAPFRDPARLEPGIAFASARGMLPFPVSGRVVRGFGAADGFGGMTKGISVATRAGAVVSSPTDGWVAFSGPFRSFGQLLIINAGDGYYVLLAGVERINVGLGQFVLAGEPVAAMGEGTGASSAFVTGSNGPILYVEFRKDGGSIDPAPWWARNKGEKVRG